MYTHFFYSNIFPYLQTCQEKKYFFLLNKFLHLETRCPPWSRRGFHRLSSCFSGWPSFFPSASQRDSRLCGWTWPGARGHLKCSLGTQHAPTGSPLSCPLAPLPGCFLFYLIPAAFLLPDQRYRHLWNITLLGNTFSSLVNILA